jgi:hypothetical protein
VALWLAEGGEEQRGAHGARALPHPASPPALLYLQLNYPHSYPYPYPYPYPHPLVALWLAEGGEEQRRANGARALPHVVLQQVVVLSPLLVPRRSQRELRFSSWQDDELTMHRTDTSNLLMRRDSPSWARASPRRCVPARRRGPRLAAGTALRVWECRVDRIGEWECESVRVWESESVGE